MDDNKIKPGEGTEPQLPIDDNSPINAEQLVTPSEIFFSWNAPEFIEHKKSSAWYTYVAVIVVILSVGAYFIVNSIFAVVAMVLIGIIFIVIAARPPKDTYYELNNLGIMAGKRAIRYDEFKSFSVIDEKNIGSLIFNPFKRFALPLNIYFDLVNEEKIVSIIKDYLPAVEPTKDPVDQLMRRLRF